MKYLVAANQTGISSRIKCLISVLRLHNRLGLLPGIQWDANYYCNCQLTDLFSIPDVVEVNSTSSESLALETWKFVVFPEEFPEKPEGNFAGCDWQAASEVQFR